MKPKLLVAGAVLVLAGLGAVLYAALGDPSPSSSGPVASGAGAPRPPAASPVDAGAMAARPRALPAVPRDPDRPLVQPGGDGGPGVREFFDEDRNRLVRDHRGAGEKPAQSPITSETIGAVRVAAQPRVAACIAKRAPGGTAKRMTAVVRMKALGGKVSLAGTKAQVEGGGEPELTACVESALNDMVVDAPENQSDAAYRVALPFEL